MINRFLDYIRENNLFSKNSKILVAVSGGIDSMVMASLFIKCGYSIGIAHCNFSLRGDESDGDEKLVQQFAATNNIPFYHIRFETLKYAYRKKVSIEVAARELRYNWFEQIRQEHNYDCVAVAHNLNDNVETVLLNITRGTGLTGLAGMRNKNSFIVRPLLFATREEIVNFSLAERINYRDDHTNAETKFSRNKIRHLVIPVLKEINPAVEKEINECATRLSELDTFLNKQIDSIKRSIFTVENETTYANIEQLSAYANNLSVVYELFKDFGVNSTLTRNILEITSAPSGKWISTPTHRILRDREQLIIARHNKETFTPIIINNVDDINDTGFLSAKIVDVDDNFLISKQKQSAYLDFEKVSFPMILRGWEEGDSFVPLGMKGRKKVSDYLIDNKISIHDKEKTLLLTSDKKIVWLIDERIDDRYKITNLTRKALVIDSSSANRQAQNMWQPQL